MKSVEIIYQDDNIVVVDKPSGVEVIPEHPHYEKKSLLGILKKQLKIELFAIHTIDLGASGVVVFAKNAEAHKFVGEQFVALSVERKFIALLSGVVEQESDIIDKAILVSGKDVSIDTNGKTAKTKYKVLEKFRGYTLVEVFPLTQMRHQMRIHFWSIGHPLAIDEEYGTNEPLLLSTFKRRYKVKEKEIEKPLIDRLTLHCLEIKLKMPGSNEVKTFVAELPKDFEVCLKQLRKYYS